MLEIFEVHSCCYYISLRTGTKIFGFLSLLSCAMASVLSVLELTIVAKVQHFVDTMLVAELVALFVQMVTSVILLLGAYQEQAKLIPPWLVSTFISAVLEVFFTSSLVGDFFGVQHRSITEWLIFTIFMLLDDIYGLFVVFSYYRSLAPQRQQNVNPRS